jgi:nicotinamide-nucleotide amidase
MTQRVEILAIGDELVHGRIRDTNSAWLANALALVGLEVARISVVGDGEAELVAALTGACERSDIVIATGGLGPTEDDRTRRAAARAAGVELAFDEAAWQQVLAVFRGYAPQRDVPPSNRRQAEFPRGARVLRNRWGSAPGFALTIKGCTFYALPGVPRELWAMWAAHLEPELAASGDASLRGHSLHAVGCPEALLGEALAEFMSEGGPTRVGITASGGQLTVRVVGAEWSVVQGVAASIRLRIGEFLVYEGDHSLAEEVVHKLIESGVTLALAESCTGGLLAAELTEVPGISAVLLAGFVTYSDAAKVRDLGVDAALLETHGAVSVEVAEAMALGAARRTGARAAVSITGIAGPGGGTAEKPVGTLCFGLCLDGLTETVECRLGNLGRGLLRQRTVREALVRLHRMVLRSLPK